MEDELKGVLKVLRENKVDLSNIKSIDISWQRVLDNKAFPSVSIKFFKEKPEGYSSGFTG